MNPVDIAAALRKNGCWRSPDLWPGALAYLDYLKTQPAYNGHVVATGDGVARTLDDALAQTTGVATGFASHTMETALRGPGLLDFILPMTAIAEDYFDGEEPLLYSINSFWKKTASDADWHMDHDDRKVMVMFMYGTGIYHTGDGPHAYWRGSHLLSETVKETLHKSGASPPAEETEIFYGPPGTWFITDTRGLHKGFHPAEGHQPRLLTWARWGVSSPPASYSWDHLAPIPVSLLNPPAADSFLKARTRLVIDWAA